MDALLWPRRMYEKKKYGDGTRGGGIFGRGRKTKRFMTIFFFKVSSKISLNRFDTEGIVGLYVRRFYVYTQWQCWWVIFLKNVAIYATIAIRKGNSYFLY